MSYKTLDNIEDIIDSKIRKAIRKHETIVAFISGILGLIVIVGLFHAILLNQAQIHTFCLK
ncbi:hypothetical protein [Nostoc sp. TCL26-01]|uniref:hypothetical protein n=1 Tax=Nostoc sp. TCL26-01 TaxID=2576904 RepID=UPI0015B9244D|nr:hypothetical protein [Nostoc sp. TCL26-01]QLE57288.1 hypothetical protein FD725_18240 [Nostoc sp. TCL26-01]